MPQPSLNILVTGGAGFIGSHLCDRLIGLGHTVVAVDNLVLGCWDFLAHLETQEKFSFKTMDVNDTENLELLFVKHAFDCVFHLAANSDISRSNSDPSIDLSSTFHSTFSVLEAMRRHGTGQIVFASSSAIYGEAAGRLNESFGPLKPISHYGAAKLASEAFISSYCGNYGIASWIARFPNVVGERATHGAVFDFVRKLRCTPERLEVLGDGTQVKPYLHVFDLLDAVLLAWRRFGESTNIFNIGGETRCSVARMAEIVVEEFGRETQIHFTGGDRGWIGDVPSVEYDTTKISTLGWKPTLTSEAAIRRAARYLFDAVP